MHLADYITNLILGNCLMSISPPMESGGKKRKDMGIFSAWEVPRTVPWFIDNPHGNLVTWASLFIFLTWGIWYPESGQSGLPAAPDYQQQDINYFCSESGEYQYGYGGDFLGGSLNPSLRFSPLYSWADAAGHHGGFSFSFLQRISGLFKVRKLWKSGNRTYSSETSYRNRHWKFKVPR